MREGQQEVRVTATDGFARHGICVMLYSILMVRRGGGKESRRNA